ncbi:cytochrome c oxidase subunit 3 [Stakelama pacifica]|uniref:Cytochrome c oxidase subunit 3 n=1 Tax=Stakelama pacifica TaxID=517720 RepID=A0A4R6FY66_9SPHN|nr:cytochrome c oxidase subunit 3 [Stakelama pacifica]MAX01281.1 cytochrome B [Sphingomonas sp.]TDN86891.1 cytochrome c oxidase subunit 3 [Stakelama pacifica]GGO90992.1 cytochrome c oxidase subunit III [Stakelama pacifica]
MSSDIALHDPFEEPARQQVAVSFGMWSFLATECLFFAGIFLFYANARWHGGEAFLNGAGESAFWFGTANTAILMTGSMAMAIAERAAKADIVRLTRWMLWAMLALGLLFLAVKGVEYRKDLHEHLFPGPDFKLDSGPAEQFWAFYWAVTAVHAVHLTIGLAATARLLWMDRHVSLHRHHSTVMASALYLHFVDIVWIALYPLLYLAGRQ